MPENLYHAILSAAATFPEAVAIETESGEVYSYSSFNRWIARYAAWLRGMGLRPGDRVLVQADKSAQLLMLCYGVIRAGAVFVPVNAGARAREMARIYSDCEPALVICDPRRTEDYANFRGQTSHGVAMETLTRQGRGSAVEAAASQAPEDAVTVVAADSPAALMYTSGTTGKPKGAIITHRNILSNGEALRNFWNWSQQEILLHTLPLYHLHGLFVATMPSLLSGSKLLFFRRFIASQAAAALPRATVFMGVPTYFSRLLTSSALTRERCSTIHLFISGSAPLPERTSQTFLERTGREILCRYGLTETGGVACTPPGRMRTLGRSGIPLPNFSVRVASHKSGETVDDRVGEIQVKGASVFPGYWPGNWPGNWRREGETAQVFTADGYFQTGDLGRMFPDGSLEIIGRAKDVIITGGANVNPLEVEAALEACPGVVESAVLGVPHPEYGEEVIAFVVSSHFRIESSDNKHIINKLMAQLKRELTIYKVPRRIFLRVQLPRNAMGKVQKNLLRQDKDLLSRDTTQRAGS